MFNLHTGFVFCCIPFYCQVEEVEQQAEDQYQEQVRCHCTCVQQFNSLFYGSEVP